MTLFEQIRADEAILAFIAQADKTLESLGYTEHSLPHLGHTSHTVKWLLEEFGYDAHTVELAQIAAFMHDIGNLVNRDDHAHTGAMLAVTLLSKHDLPPADVARIATAIGHHDEATAHTIDEITCCLIIADKSDVRRSRVRCFDPATEDIHDRVNYAVKQADLVLSEEKTVLTLKLTIDTSISTVAEYFEIFLSRMLLCRKAARFFDVTFRLMVNNGDIF